VLWKLIERWRLRRALGRVHGRLVSKNVLAYLERSDRLVWQALADARKARDADRTGMLAGLLLVEANLERALSEHDAIKEMLDAGRD
jgi:hypothetical protein